jgi:hypothetical protein
VAAGCDERRGGGDLPDTEGLELGQHGRIRDTQARSNSLRMEEPGNSSSTTAQQ